MLSAETQDGITWIYPIFGTLIEQLEDAKDAVVLSLDDCECDECEEERGPLMELNTVILAMSYDTKIMRQRLTSEEAKLLGESLLDMARTIDELNGGEELDESEEFVLEEI